MAFQGSLNELPLPDIIQLVSVSGKTGMFTLSHDEEAGEIYLRDGQIVHAKAGGLEGEEAVYELAIWRQGDFVFTPGHETPATTIQKSNTNLLMEAARRIDEWQILSKKISSTRLIPVFNDKAVNTSVSFTPQEWAIICRIDGRRSIEEIAVALAMSPFETCKHLYGLVTSGLIDLKEDLTREMGAKLQQLGTGDLSQLLDQVDVLARRLLADHQRVGDLDRAREMSRAEMDAGRGVDAALDLVRAHEQVVSAALGPNQSKVFMGEVRKLVGQTGA